MGINELRKQLNKSRVEYKGADIRAVSHSGRALKIGFRGADVQKSAECLCDFIVYSLRETGINLSMVPEEDIKIVQGAAYPILGVRKTIYEVNCKKGDALFNISPTAPQYVAGYKPEEILRIIADYVSSLK